MRLNAPQTAPAFDLTDIYGKQVRLDDYRGKRVMLSFFRDAACPFCNLRVYELSHHYKDWQNQGLEIIAFFRSSPADIKHYVARHPRPFTIIGDEQLAIYSRYGVEHSLLGMVRGIMLRMPRMMRALFNGFIPRMRGDQTLVPADFLIDEQGQIRVVYYGRDIGDHIPFGLIKSFVAAGHPDPVTEPACTHKVA